MSRSGTQGLDPAEVRAVVVEETVELMKQLWHEDVVSYEGTCRKLAPSRSWPKPCQQPHPPVLLGAPASERNFDRVVRWDAAGKNPDSLQLLSLLTTTPTAELPSAIAIAARLGVQQVAVRVSEGDRDEVLARLDRLARSGEARLRVTHHRPDADAQRR